ILAGRAIVTRLAVAGLRLVIPEDNVVKDDIASLREDGAAPGIGGLRLDLVGAVVLCQASLDGKVAENDPTVGKHLEDSVQVVAVDDRLVGWRALGSSPLDDQGVMWLVDVQVPFGSETLLLPGAVGDAKQVGRVRRGRQKDQVVLIGVKIGQKDGVAQA